MGPLRYTSGPGSGSQIYFFLFGFLDLYPHPTICHVSLGSPRERERLVVHEVMWWRLDSPLGIDMPQCRTCTNKYYFNRSLPYYRPLKIDAPNDEHVFFSLHFLPFSFVEVLPDQNQTCFEVFFFCGEWVGRKSTEEFFFFFFSPWIRILCSFPAESSMSCLLLPT